VTRAVLTGPSRGIGRATALELARRGVDLWLVGRASPGLDAVAEQARQEGVRADTLVCDLALADQVERVGEALNAHGAPAAVIHNAAIIERGPIEDISVASWDRHLAVNLRAPFQLTRALLPAMRRAGGGRFVFVGSIASSVGSANAAAYCASKWGIVGFTKSLAEELTDSGLSAVAILPGSVATDMLEGSGFSSRMSAEDVARTIVHHALDAPLAHNGGVVEMFGT
jgi:3-oxoacyl-[acyl-carrier protein] reductase